jgi:hypothetical protein
MIELLKNLRKDNFSRLTKKIKKVKGKNKNATKKEKSERIL